MEEKKTLTDSLPDSYRTGDVQPPKSHRGIITLLLLLVIFLGSLVSVLSFANIQLFRLLNSGEEIPVHFISDVQLEEAREPEDRIQLSGLGIEGQFLTQFDQHYFDLPQGIYITEVADFVQGVFTGDILTGINNIPVTDPDTVSALLDSYHWGDALRLEIYRNGKMQTVTAVIE